MARGGNLTKKQDFWPKKNHIEKKSLYFANSTGDSYLKSAKIWLSKWIFYVKNHPKNIFW